jgi:hypothetical protein
MNIPSTENYSKGKGILYIAEYNPLTGVIGSYSDVGNAPSLEYEPKATRDPHYSSRAGYKTKDKNPVTQLEYTVRFELDELAAANIAKFMMGAVSGGQVLGMTEVDKEYSLKFVSDNPTGPNYTYFFWRGTLAPNGAAQLIKDEWLTLAYMFDGLADTIGHSTSPYMNASFSSSSRSSSSSSSSSST